MTKPTWKHNCDTCAYLGSVIIDHKTTDYYHCPQGGDLIYRHGHKGGDCGSALIDYVSPLSLNACIALSLLVKSRGANGASGFFSGRFSKDDETVLTVGQ